MLKKLFTLLPWLIPCLFLISLIINPLLAGRRHYRESGISLEVNPYYSKEFLDIVWYVQTGYFSEETPVIIPFFYLIEALAELLTEDESYTDEESSYRREMFLYHIAGKKIAERSTSMMQYRLDSVSLAGWLSLVHNRDELLSFFLDSVSFGTKEKGASRVCLNYFQKELHELSLEEMTDLAFYMYKGKIWLHSPDYFKETRERALTDIKRRFHE